MNVQLARLSILHRHGKKLRPQPRAFTDFARHAPHEHANAVARKFAFRRVVKPLHLRDQPFERPRIFSPIRADRLLTRSKIKRLFEFVRQLGERHFFVHLEMFHQRGLQMPVVNLHPFRRASPRRDRAFG